MSVRVPVWVAVIAALLLSTLAAPAVAAPPRSAVRLTEAFLRAERAMAALAPEYRRRGAEMRPVCGELAPEPPGRAEPVSEEDDERAALLGIVAFLEPTYTPAMPVLHQLVSDLEAIPTRDRALRRGRAAWRAYYDELRRFPAIDDACGKLAGWRDSGWAPDQAPQFDVRALQLWLRQSHRRDASREAAIARASGRLRDLGVSRRRAAAFRGGRLFAPAVPIHGFLVGEVIGPDD